MKIQLSDKIEKDSAQVHLFKKESDLSAYLTSGDLKYLNKEENQSKDWLNLSHHDDSKFVVSLNNKNTSLEKFRSIGAEIGKLVKGKVQIVASGTSVSKELFALVEGVYLSNYAFDKYLTKKDKKGLKLKIVCPKMSVKKVDELNHVLEAVCNVRNWVNEPVNKLDTTAFLKEINQLSKLGGEVDVFRKSKLQSLNMGGILGVNKGSNEEPALAIVEWKPKGAKNKKPIVLVGKGILFDTGGINIKTGDFMTDMKADMGGAATMLGAMKACIQNKLPIHLVALLPITENRINGNELVPGDVITMHSGKTVEVLNTDAEGRLVLADALSFAKKYKPSLVIDAATLTGSAFRTSGHHGGVIMGTSLQDISALKNVGDLVYERLVELPMWPELEESLKSNIADLNNLGAGPGQAVCAGFFLKNFVDYPWVHLDIAGPAFIPNDSKYSSKGGTGFGVRLLYQFLKDKFDLN